MPSYMQRLRNLREDHDMTQKQIAQILGTSQTMYARYERGGSELPIRHLITLCRYYQVSADLSWGWRRRLYLGRGRQRRKAAGEDKRKGFCQRNKKPLKARAFNGFSLYRFIQFGFRCIRRPIHSPRHTKHRTGPAQGRAAARQTARGRTDLAKG